MLNEDGVTVTVGVVLATLTPAEVPDAVLYTEELPESGV
jgi:hypothetical protein